MKQLESFSTPLCSLRGMILALISWENGHQDIEMSTIVKQMMAETGERDWWFWLTFHCPGTPQIPWLFLR